MIIIGYQGIGKSTLSNNNVNYIDLESGNFWINGKRYDDWYIPYCNIAEHLSQQGKNVFVSSHEVVRKQLEQTKERVIVICPDISLKEQWINKLQERYNYTQLEKDYKALMNAKERYTEKIKEIIDNKFEKIIINNINDNLEELIKVN